MPKSEQEDTDLYKAFQALGIISAALDGNDYAIEGKWVDSSGQALTYTNWYPGQPSNHDGRQHYLEYAANEMKGQWNDAEGDHKENIVCELPVKSKTFLRFFPSKNQFLELDRDPSERLTALQAKALEVVELGGWKANSAFYDRVAKKLGQVSDSSGAKRKQLMIKGCEFPEHWDWQAYMVRFV